MAKSSLERQLERQMKKEKQMADKISENRKRQLKPLHLEIGRLL